MVRTSRKLPKDWAKYGSVGNVVPGTRFFAFKVPLSPYLASKYFPEHRFSIADLYSNLTCRDMELGLVVNATNTDRYYDKKFVTNFMIDYHKLPMSGRSFVDCEGLVKDFIKVVDDFLERNKDNGLLIGVHCTDGVNRAGYLICRYLIDRLCLSSHDALNAVETARGYIIERGSLVQALHRADRARRLRKRSANDDQDEEDLTERERRRKKRKQKEVVATDDGFDPQMLQKVLQLEQSLRQTAQTSSSDFNSPNMQVKVNQSSSFEATVTHYPPLPNVKSETSSPYMDSPAMDDDEEDEDESEERQIDFSMMGKIDVRDVSIASRRRVRRKNLTKKYDVMKRGKFWEINEMRKNN